MCQMVTNPFAPAIHVGQLVRGSQIYLQYVVSEFLPPKIETASTLNLNILNRLFKLLYTMSIVCNTLFISLSVARAPSNDS
jgi:hypothetical protein